MGLLPFVNLSHIHWSDDVNGKGNTYTFTQGFWNLKFYSGDIGDGTNPAIADPHANVTSLSATAITICTLMGISILSILIGFMETGGKLFTSSSANKFFCWFAIYVIIIMLLISIAMFLGKPSEDRDTENIWRSSYFAGKVETIKDPNTDEEFTTIVGALTWPMNSLWIRPTNNYYILLVITLFATISLITLSLIACKQMLPKQPEVSFSQIKRKQTPSVSPALNPTV